MGQGVEGSIQAFQEEEKRSHGPREALQLFEELRVLVIIFFNKKATKGSKSSIPNARFTGSTYLVSR